MKKLALLGLFVLAVPFTFGALTDGLVSFFEFEHGSGSNVIIDSQGNMTYTSFIPYNPTIIGSTPIPIGQDGDCIFGKCYNKSTQTVGGSGFPIDTRDEYHNYEKSFYYPNATICTWFKSFTMTQTSGYIMGNRRTTAPSRTTNVFSLRVFRNDTSFPGQFNFYIHNGTVEAPTLMSQTDVYTDRQWHYLCGSWGSLGLRLYVDGVLENSTNISITHQFPNTQTADMWIGSTNGGINDDSMTGLLDDFAIWNRYLSESEVSVLYNSGNGLEYPLVVVLGVAVSSPPNNTVTNVQPTVLYNVSNTLSGTAVCDLNVDGSKNLTQTANQSVVNSFSPTLADGVHTFSINCTDSFATGQTGQFNIKLDTSQPLILSGSPNEFNTSVFSGYSMTIAGNVTNVNLTNVTRTLYYPNSTVFYANTTTSFGDPTFYSWVDIYNTTLEPNGIWTMVIHAKDEINQQTKYISFELDNCVPDWSCSGFTACNTTDQQLCNAVTDTNLCGLPYSGDYSEFGVLSCNYCSADVVQLNASACISRQQTVWYQDLNFPVCCNVTGIGSDCPLNGSIGTGVVACSPFAYTTDDIPEAVISGLGKLVLEITKWVAIAVVLFVFFYSYFSIKNYFKNRSR